MASAEMVRMTMEDELRQQLDKHHCVRGQLQYQSPAVVSLVGTRGDGKAVFIWQATSRLSYLLSQYVEQQTNCVGLTVEIDLVRNQFEYKWLSPATVQQSGVGMSAEQINMERTWRRR
jgi:hypothetical protein